jgi:glutamine synthetase
LQAAILAAGLDGIASKRDPGSPLDINMYTHGHTIKDVKKLPLNLLDALRGFGNSSALEKALGAEFKSAYLKLRQDNWNEYARQLTPWERNTTLDC